MKRDEHLIERAIAIAAEYGPDALDGADVSNSLAGSLLAIETRSPRWATEAAVREAARRLARRQGGRS